MVVGRFAGEKPPIVQDIVQIIDLSPQRKFCPNKQKYPFGVESATGAIVSGNPVVCGGHQESTYEVLPQCYKYDNSTNSWTFLTNMTFNRGFSASVALNDKLFVIGGVGYNWDEIYSSTEYISLDGNASQPGPELPLPRARHCAVKLSTGKMMTKSSGQLISMAGGKKIIADSQMV